MSPAHEAMDSTLDAVFNFEATTRPMRDLSPRAEWACEHPSGKCESPTSCSWAGRCLAKVSNPVSFGRRASDASLATASKSARASSAEERLASMEMEALEYQRRTGCSDFARQEKEISLQRAYIRQLHWAIDHFGAEQQARETA